MQRNILTSTQRSKEDTQDDSIFYSHPRFTYHLDDRFRIRLEELYQLYIPENSIVLDLMSSWVSHLPTTIRYKRVIGHGMNLLELEKNKVLDSFWVQDFNQKQKLPLDNSSIDVCLIVAAWQYLQYPEEIASELKRIIRKEGLLIISFSNRAFWSKAPQIWRENSEIGRINYIKEILLAAGWIDFEVIQEKQDITFIESFMGQQRDPFFSIIARNQ